MEYKVTKQHWGDRQYFEGDTREVKVKSDAEQLMKMGLIVDADSEAEKAAAEAQAKAEKEKAAAEAEKAKAKEAEAKEAVDNTCLLYTSPSPRD